MYELNQHLIVSIKFRKKSTTYLLNNLIFQTANLKHLTLFQVLFATSLILHHHCFDRHKSRSAALSCSRAPKIHRPINNFIYV